jgi:hypothetical protein
MAITLHINNPPAGGPVSGSFDAWGICDPKPEANAAWAELLDEDGNVVREGRYKLAPSGQDWAFRFGVANLEPDSYTLLVGAVNHTTGEKQESSRPLEVEAPRTARRRRR